MTGGDFSDTNHVGGLKDSIQEQESFANKHKWSSNVVVATIIWAYHQIFLLSQDVRSLMCDGVLFSQVEVELNIPLLTKSFAVHFRNFLGTQTTL